MTKFQSLCVPHAQCLQATFLNFPKLLDKLYNGNALALVIFLYIYIFFYLILLLPAKIYRKQPATREVSWIKKKKRKFHSASVRKATEFSFSTKQLKGTWQGKQRLQAAAAASRLNCCCSEHSQDNGSMSISGNAIAETVEPTTMLENFFNASFFYFFILGATVH